MNRTVAELSMLPVALIIDLSLVRRIDADRLEALTIAATLAGESDIAFCLAAVSAGPVMAAIDSQELTDLSAVWAGAILFSAIVGAYGDGMLRDNDNFWTAWILPLAAIIFAGAFTEFYPDYASGDSTSYARIFDWMPPFIMVTGIVGWVSDAAGIALIVVGAVGSAVMRKVSPAKTEATERQ